MGTTTAVPALTTTIAALLALGSIAMFAIQVRRGVWFAGYDDETVHLLGGRVLNGGGLLYRDFVDNHGPFIYALTDLFGRLAGWANPNLCRLVPVLFAGLAGVAVMTSPALESATQRLCAAAFYFSVTASLWLRQGLYLVSFYPVAGALAVVILSWFVAPAWLDRPAGTARPLGAGVAATLLLFTGCQYAPALLLFIAAGACSGWRNASYRSFAACCVGALFCLAIAMLWLAVKADIPGYLAFHVAFARTAYLPLTGLEPRAFLSVLIPSVRPEHLVQAIACGMGLVALLLLAAVQVGLPLRRRGLACLRGDTILGLLGVVALNPLATINFKNGSFVMGGAGTLAIVLASCVSTLTGGRQRLRPALPVLTGILIGVVQLAAGQARKQPLPLVWPTAPVEIARRSDSRLANRIRDIVAPHESFLALVYQPSLYWEADRLPMSGFFAWLPWDAVYARRPWFNRPRDICVALAASPPKVIVFDNAVVWDIYRPRDFMPCVIAALATRYCPDAALPTLYIRNDLAQRKFCTSDR